MTYNNIDFGRISAEEEARKNPGLITDGYYEYKDSIKKLWNDSQFLVIGGKGSGKTLIGQKLKSYQDSSHFITLINMNDFQYKSFKKIVPGFDDVDRNSSYSIAWRFIFCIYAIESFCQDCGKEAENDGEFHSAIEALKRQNILPVSSIGDIVKLSSKKAFSLSLGNASIGGVSLSVNEKETKDLSVDDATDMLMKILEKCQSDNNHLIVVDGLDHNLSEKGTQFPIIMELIKTAMSFNDLMSEKAVPVKIVVLCRTDIYDRLKDPNKNKITRSYTIKLDWYQDQINANDLELVKLVERRAKICGCDNLFDKFFLEKMDGKDIRKYLLDNTRYTPRDFVQLLTILKEFHTTEKFNRSQIENAVKKYSQEYFWGEINDELSGYIPNDQIENVYTLFRDLGKKEFTVGDLEEQIRKRGNDINLNLENVLKVLYDCGAINMILSNGNYQCRYKNGGPFDIRQRMILHRATYKALSIE